MTAGLRGELDFIAEQFGVDVGNVINLILHEQSHEYLKRAKAIARRRAEQADTQESTHAEKPQASRKKRR